MRLPLILSQSVRARGTFLHLLLRQCYNVHRWHETPQVRYVTTDEEVWR